MKRIPAFIMSVVAILVLILGIFLGDMEARQDYNNKTFTYIQANCVELQQSTNSHEYIVHVYKDLQGNEIIDCVQFNQGVN